MAAAALGATIYYINYIYPDSRPIHDEWVKSYLIDTKPESWLQSRIDEGKAAYDSKVQAKIIEREVEIEKLMVRVRSCKEGTDAYRLKNKYECGQAIGRLANLSVLVPSSTYSSNKPYQFFDQSEQDEEIKKAIIRDCLKAKTIRQARRIGCYY